MKNFLLLVGMVSIAITQTHAQVSGNVQYRNGTNPNAANIVRGAITNPVISPYNDVQFVVNGLMNITADHYVAVFNILQVAESVDSANKIMNLRVKRFKSELGKIGIDSNDVSIDLLSFVPNYDIQQENKLFSKSYNEIPAGFEVQKNISVIYKKSGKLDDIMSAATKSEIYDIIKVDYFIADIEKLRDSLQTKCLTALKRKIKTYSITGFNFDSAKKNMADQFATVYPQTRYLTYQAFARPSLNAAKKKSSGTPVVNEVPKNTTKYYSQVDYDEYDIVLNPVVTEPVIQVSYSVVIKYSFEEKKEEKPAAANNYYIITQAGDIKQINPK